MREFSGVGVVWDLLIGQRRTWLGALDFGGSSLTEFR